MNTRERIIYNSLKLFSVDGFDTVSTRMIAREAGISDTAIYKHFKSKQEIFDIIIQICKERFVSQQMKVDIRHICWEDVDQICMDMFFFQTQDEWIVMFRRLLIVEQFKNPEMSKLFQSFFIDTALIGMSQIFEELIKTGYMKKCNPRVLAMELYAPFFMYHTIQPDAQKILDELRQHAIYFKENYRIIKCEEE